MTALTRELAGPLDHRCLHRARFPADMRGHLGPRLAHQSRFLGALIELRQGDWAVCRADPRDSCSMRQISIFEHLCYPCVALGIKLHDAAGQKVKLIQRHNGVGAHDI